MTLILPGAERFVDALHAKLTAGLPAVISEINARDTKGVVLDAPQVFDYVPSPSEMNTFPAVCIRDGEEDLKDDVGWAATGEMDLVIVCFALHADQRTLALTLRRLVQAAKTVALDGRNLNVPGDATSAWGMRFNGTRPGPTLGRNEGPRDWMSYAALGLTVMGEDHLT